MIWTGPNDAPLSTKEERMAELTLDFRDAVRTLEWYELWQLGEADAPEALTTLPGGAMVARHTIDAGSLKITAMFGNYIHYSLVRKYHHSVVS